MRLLAALMNNTFFGDGPASLDISVVFVGGIK
jgi:hypothetical protein